MKTVEFNTPSGGHQYAPLVRNGVVSLAAVFLAFVARYCLNPALDEDLPLTPFVIAALVVSWHRGAFTGSLTLIFGLVVGDYFFVGPTGSLGISNRSELMQFIRATLLGGVGISLIGTMRRGRRRAEFLAQELAREVVRRRQSEAALLEAQHALGRHAAELEARVEERTAALSGTVTSLRELLHHIAHNLRGPARALQAYSSFLLEECGPQLGSTGRDYASRIAAAARRLETLIAAVLDFGRLDHTAVCLTDTSLEEAMQKALARLADQIKASNAEVRVASPLPPVRADPEALGQVLRQLLGNAIKFVAAGTQPRVQVWAEPHDSVIRLWVEDNGIGVESRYQERIFRAFERLHPPQAYEGAGMGLAIVQHAMQRMKGKAGVVSVPEGGSRFWVEFARTAG